MNKIKLTISVICIFILSCSDSNTRLSNENVPVIHINMDDVENAEQNLCFSKIELIPLETSEESIIGNERDVVITDQFYIISDHLNVVSVFDKKGNFISNSKKNWVSVLKNIIHSWVFLTILF